MRKLVFLLLLTWPLAAFAQNKMTPELLWSLGRLSANAIGPDKQSVLYSVTHIDATTEKSTTKYFFLDLKNNQTAETNLFEKKSFVQWNDEGIYAREKGKLFLTSDKGSSWIPISDKLKNAEHIRISPDGNWALFSKPVLVEKVLGSQLYKDLPKSTAQIYTDLNYRHWDKWYDGKVSHLFLVNLKNTNLPVIDLLKGTPYDCPQKPFGGVEDFIFSPDSKTVLYVCKKKAGKEYAQSTNTDIYAFDLHTKTTKNLTEGMMGYDVAPAFSPDGTQLAWLSMATDGFEADKRDIIVMDWQTGAKKNLTAAWDETVDAGFLWANSSASVYFSASIRGTQQLFQVAVKDEAKVLQITQGNFNVTDLIGQRDDHIIAGRTDFNHATELFSIGLKDGVMQPVTHVNDQIYAGISMGTSELKMVKTTDGKDMGVWVIYPPDFDPGKKYPTLLYCQGGPQGALSQFYSYRWNFQLMAAQGYIVVAPNRRGMPGWGVEWNACISKDWGGMPMQDYLAAIDAVDKEPYVDTAHLGCVGASYGGYSVFMLAGMHDGRFKTFIAHDGLFDMKSWYGTTEELWFANWDLGGNYWQNPIPKSYVDFNPSNFVAKWDTPIMIVQGGIDFRVPIEQGLEAFQAAQLRGIKSKLLYFPNENHWVLHAQNALVWQREFFKWLKETI